MVAFASESDLQDFIPDVFTFGVNSFSKDLQFASDDVVNLIKSGWWQDAVRKNFVVQEMSDSAGFGFFPLDLTRLNAPALMKATVYRVASAYIYPKLSTFKDVDGDSFSRKATFYGKLYREEWDVIRRLPLYDFNRDGLFTDIERRVTSGRSISRA